MKRKKHSNSFQHLSHVSVQHMSEVQRSSSPNPRLWWKPTRRISTGGKGKSNAALWSLSLLNYFFFKDLTTNWSFSSFWWKTPLQKSTISNLQCCQVLVHHIAIEVPALYVVVSVLSRCAATEAAAEQFFSCEAAIHGKLRNRLVFDLVRASQ